ncbi:hypothetical protein L3Y34_019761 [Caenorhabditis briggsae]|uniref:C-type lectin domain-containing protein n=1 Tax=Caenorhabditis briggsae TaxID=6238 RepID=A0AAE9DPL5_CAEBR|nr:hypothetical protein L3Y34_019761 [Caenorhabditis briggsae]
MRLSLFTILFTILLPSCLFADIVCPSGFTLINQQKCLKVYTAQVQHLDATKQCTSLGGTLVTIKNAIDNRAVANFAANAGLSNFWIGGFCYTRDEVACFHDDSSGVMTYNSFGAGYPQNNFAIGQCVYMKTSGTSAGQWATNRCHRDTMPYVCEVPLTLEDQTCQHNYNGYCYLPDQEILGPTQLPKDFKAAQDICQANNANLASIHSKQEIDYIKTLYRSSGVDEILLGAQASKPHVFKWIDGSAFGYSYRNPFDNSTENCLKMSVTDELGPNQQMIYGTWSETGCQEVNNFLCKRRIVGKFPQTAEKQKAPVPVHYDITDPSNCNNTMLIAPGTITSFGYGTSPLPGGFCYYKIAAIGAYRVAIHFTDFSTWYNVDVTDQFGENVARLYNSRDPFSVLVESTIAVLTHDADKDASSDRHGFKAVVLPF